MKLGIREAVASIAAVAILVLPQASMAVAASPAPIPGGPAGAGVCSAQAATARSGGTVAALRAFGDCEVARRTTTLGELTATIDASKVLTAAHKSTLASEVGATAAGLATLKASIDAAATPAVLKLRIVEIATTFRVYDLVVPQVMLTNAADGIVAMGPLFAGISTGLAGRISSAQAAGKNTIAAQAALDAMNVATATADASASPLPAGLLALTPAQFNAGTAGPVLRSARASVVSARDQLKSAVADARAVLADLK